MQLQLQKIHARLLSDVFVNVSETGECTHDEMVG